MKFAKPLIAWPRDADLPRQILAAGLMMFLPGRRLELLSALPAAEPAAANRRDTSCLTPRAGLWLIDLHGRPLIRSIRSVDHFKFLRSNFRCALQKHSPPVTQA